MRSWMWLGVIAALSACGDKDSSDGDVTDDSSTTDTDTDDTDTTDTDTEDTTDTTPPGDSSGPDTAADTGLGSTLPARTPGCAPEYALVTEPDYGNCQYTDTTTDLASKKKTSVVETTLDANGGWIESLTTDFTTQPPTIYRARAQRDADGYLDQYTIDLADDGSIDEVVDYTYTFDANGNATERHIDVTDAQGNPLSSSITMWTWGSCSIDLLENDDDGDGNVDSSEAYTYYDDGYRVEQDFEGDGIVDEYDDMWVDPVTGQQQHYESEFFTANHGPELSLDYTSFDANGDLLALSGTVDAYYYYYAPGYGYDIEGAFTYDADFRETKSVISYLLGGQLFAGEQVSTTWSCPP